MISIKNKFLFLFTIIFIGCLAINPAPVFAAEDDSKTVNLATMTDIKRLELAKFLLDNTQADKAIQAISFKNFQSKNHIVIAQNILADSLFAVGQKTEAIAVLRNLLSADPELTLVRYKLAQMLFATEDDLAAKHHFQILRAGIKDDSNQTVIDQYLKQLDLRKRWFFNIGGNVLPQSNYNGGSSKKLYYCEDTASTPEGIAAWTNLLAAFGLDCKAGIPLAASEQAQSGVVISGNVSGGYRFRLDENVSWTIRGTGEYTRYPGATSDVITLALNSGPTISLSDKTRLNINGIASISISNKAITQKHYAASATIDHVFSPQVSSSFTANISNTESITNNDYSNTLGSFNASVQIAIDNSSFVRLMGGVAKTSYVEPNLSYWQVNGGVGYYKEIEYGITLYTEADISYRAKPLEAITTYNINAKLTKRDFNFLGFSPQLIYNYNRADSNVSRNDTDSHRVTIGITRSF